MTRRALIALATGWGPRHGGINSFNYDFLRGFAAAFVDVRVVCVVPQASSAELLDAKHQGVDLRTLPYVPQQEVIGENFAKEIAGSVCSDLHGPESLWLGHDVFTGQASNAIAKITGGRSALIHHMSYDTYKGYERGSSTVAREKTEHQKVIFCDADVRFAVGPLLRDELNSWFAPGNCTMLIPGLPEIEPQPAPAKWNAILFGRLNPETDRIKQTKLAVAAVARCYKQARQSPGLAKKLRDGPCLKLFGVDQDAESELRDFVEAEAGAVLELHALPYTEDRPALFNELCHASVALIGRRQSSWPV